ncbi:metal-dependent hydrolase [Candidatus Saccharibacteria bacterium]|nr:MAG: metal-dependent hydrolase [Candidatus Saccharibacteria bacterium]
MTARTHDTAALLALISYVIVVPPGKMTLATGLAAVLANQLGGIAPDIDQPTAPLWRNIPIGRYFGRIFGALVGGHRFFCHSILGVAVFGALSMLLLQFLQPIMPNIDINFVWVAFLTGVVSHLIMDSLTKEGVPWLLPIPYKFGFPPIRSWRVTTGKWVENIIILPGLIALTTWLCATNYTTLADLIQRQLIK